MRYLNATMLECLVIDQEKLDINLTSTQDLALERKLIEFKSEILDTVRKEILLQGLKPNSDGQSVTIINGLKEENMALKKQLDVLTGLLEVIVPLVQKLNEILKF